MDILCVFGRGIEQVDGIWQPTQYIEKLSPQGGHPGYRVPDISPDDDDTDVVIAGAEVNVLAASALYRRSLSFLNAAPKAVIFAAGRPAYLMGDPDPDLTEGKILKERFLQETAGPSYRTETIVQSRNKNTRDDLLETLSFAKARGFSYVTIVTVLVHIARCQEFLRHALIAEPEFGNITVDFVASEPIVINERRELARYLYNGLISPAYERTAAKERKGIADLRAGKYNFGTQGYAFAKK